MKGHGRGGPELELVPLGRDGEQVSDVAQERELRFFFILMVEQGDSKLSTLQKFLHSSPTHSKVMPIFVSKKEIF